MNKERRNASYSSNLFRNVNRRLKNMNVEIDRLKKQYEGASNLFEIQILKPYTQPYKQNLQPVNKQTKVNSFRLRPATIKNQIVKFKMVSLKLKDIEGNHNIQRFCRKITIKYGKFIQIKQWTLIIDSELVFQPKKFWNRTNNTKQSSRIKPEIILFLEYINIISSVSIIFRVRNDQELSEIQHYLTSQGLNYHCIFYVPNKYTQAITLYNLHQINNISDKIILLEEKLKKELVLPALTRSTQITILYIQQICLKNKKYIIQNLKDQEISINTNTISRFQLNPYEVSQKIKIQEINLEKKSTKRLRCKSTEHISFVSTTCGNKMEIFKEKMVKYIKLVQQEKKHKQGNSNFSKTPNQIIAQLSRLNSNNSRQIQNYINNFQALDRGHLDMSFNFLIPMYLVS